MKQYGTDVVPSYISQIEGAGKLPSVPVLTALAEVLGTTTDYLLLLTDNPKPPNENTISPTAKAVMTIVESMPEAKRLEVLDVLRAMAAHVDK